MRSHSSRFERLHQLEQLERRDLMAVSPIVAVNQYDIQQQVVTAFMNTQQSPPAPASARPFVLATADRAAAIDAAIEAVYTPELTPVKQLEFDTPPTQMPGVYFATNAQYRAEEELFTTSDGFLRQHTQHIQGWAGYSSSPDASLRGKEFKADQYIAMEAKLRVNDILARYDPTDPSETGFQGGYFGFYDSKHAYVMQFDEQGGFVNTPDGEQHVPFSRQEFHTFRITKSDAGGRFDLFIDGTKVLSAQATDSDLNGFAFGDGSSRVNHGGTIDWDYVRIFTGDASVTEDSAPLEALAAQLEQDRADVLEKQTVFDDREAKARAAVARDEGTLRRFQTLPDKQKNLVVGRMQPVIAHLARVRQATEYWSVRADAAADALQRITAQQARVGASLQDVYESNATKVAEAQRETLRQLADKLRRIEETPIDQQSADAQALALSVLTDELQASAGTMLTSALSRSEGSALAARTSLSPLQTDLQTLADRIQTQSEKVFAELDRRVPDFITAAVDLVPGAVGRVEWNDVTHSVYTDIALPPQSAVRCA